ncbi:small conductance mechanosensitive channel [Tessaracoccus bendigoensis DSM 12906]|uniref:Small conductance mechanosensitive channel n=1 Tax=Tessaracoccus bendigoensis DSM 12906 TaxID=1123357 RepID=A0A1M6LZH0_9ACTN|nr:mechanosensitive ion channel family protein [Tessaracoccus bendigoensis]SHJ76571.1 small conductance mechanosensitive channel [Tessaracoccus bendigoensis DSM 12906]
MADFWEKLLLAVIVIAVALLVRTVARFVIRRSVRALTARQASTDGASSESQGFHPRSWGASERQRQRIDTLGSLLRNVVDVALVVVALLTVLAIFGVPMGPLLASAGVGGVAIGFGAQSLVKDYLSGIFMLSEDQFGVGDLIKVGELTGTVQEVTLRVTQLRDPSGTAWYVRNGEILTLGNVSQGFSTVTVDIPVALDEDQDKVTSLLREAVAGMATEAEWSGKLLEEPSVLGVGDMSGGTMTIQISLKARPNEQWGPARAVRERAQRALAEAGIRGPILPATPTQ